MSNLGIPRDDWAVELPEDCAGIAPGDGVDYLPFGGLGVDEG